MGAGDSVGANSLSDVLAGTAARVLESTMLTILPRAGLSGPSEANHKEFVIKYFQLCAADPTVTFEIETFSVNIPIFDVLLVNPAAIFKLLRQHGRRN